MDTAERKVRLLPKGPVGAFTAEQELNCARTKPKLTTWTRLHGEGRTRITIFN